jgi:hypothetical protein
MIALGKNLAAADRMLAERLHRGLFAASLLLSDAEETCMP